MVALMEGLVFRPGSPLIHARADNMQMGWIFSAGILGYSRRAGSG
jgi:hypothetical protein